MSLRSKLVSAFLVTAAITLMIGLVGWWGMKRMAAGLAQTTRIDEIGKVFLHREIDHLNWVRLAGEFQYDETLTRLKVEKDPHKCGFGQWYYGSGRKEAEATVPEIRELLQALEEPHLKLHLSAEGLEQLLATGSAGRAAAIVYFRNETGAQLRKMQELFGSLRPRLDECSKRCHAAREHQARASTMITVVGVTLGTILALSLGISMSLSLARRLNGISNTISVGARQTALAAKEVSSASQSLAEGASEQAASLEETSASLEEMSSMTSRNSEDIQKANQVAREARLAADDGTKDMQEMITAIEAIRSSSDEVSKIIKTIDGIAFQTNILALNAAVEAARAGDAGLGFAVVADEVRALAQRSAQAAKETASKIEGAIARTSQGVRISNKVATALQNIVAKARQVDELTAQIAAASGEQSQGTEQINKAVSEMDKVTQSTAANAEESAATAQELDAQAKSLNSGVDELLSIVEGGGKRRGAGEAKARPSEKLRTRMKVTRSVPVLSSNKGRFPDIDRQGTASGVSASNRNPNHKAASEMNLGSQCPPVNCWEFKKCGREAGGAKARELGVCPAYPDHGRACATVAGTLCGGKVQGTFAQKLTNCMQCPFFESANYQRTNAEPSVRTVDLHT